MVTENRAHVWVEAYVDGEGWITIDPSVFAVNGGTLRPAVHRTFRRQLELLMDSFSYRWNQTVVSFDFESQMRFMTNTETVVRGFNGKWILEKAKNSSVEVIGGLLLLMVATIFLWRKMQSAEKRLICLFLRKAAKAGIAVTPASGLQEIAKGIGSPYAEEFVAVYGGAVYRGRRLSRLEADHLRKLLRRM